MQNYKEKIIKINNRLDKIVQLVDTKKHFFNNIFFPEKDREIPMNLYNIHYTSSKKDYKFLENDDNIKEYNFEQPNKIFLLPSSDDSGNEKTDDNIPSFTKICNDIIDLETLVLFKTEEDLKKIPENVHPILMFRGYEPFLSMEKVINFIQNNNKKPPYEVKIVPIIKNSENKYKLTFIVSFNTLEEVKNIQNILSNQYNIVSKICYDIRESNNAKWYCVVFRREAGGEQRLNKFVNLICDIYRKIPDKNKSYINTSVEGTCEAKIEKKECIRKLGDILYCAIKVDSLEQALLLCVQYNHYYDMKVNLHNITYKLKKNKIPQVMIDKEIKGEIKYENNKIRKTFKEDNCYKNDACDVLFPKKDRLLSRKHKRMAIKQGA